MEKEKSMKIIEKSIFVFCFLYLILPDFLGIEFSASLPLLTSSRILILLLIAAAVYITVKRGSMRILAEKKIWLAVAGFFVLRTVSNIYYLTTYSGAINNIFKMIIEEIILLLIIPVFLETEEKRMKALRVLTYSCGVISALGITESLTGFRLADYLYTVKRFMFNDHYIRLGILRATTSFGLANFYAFYLTVMTPVIFYLWRKTDEKRYMVIALLHFFALVFSGCRGNILIYFVFLAGYLFMIAKAERSKYLMRLLQCLCIVIALILVQRAVSPKLKYYYDGTAKSLLNVVGFKFDLNKGAPEGVSGYGHNSRSGVTSRLYQFSGITYAMGINPLFGLGAGAQNRGEIMYYDRYVSQWKYYSTYDVGYVAAICDEGIIGAAGYACLYAGITLFFFIALLKEKDEKKKDILKMFFMINGLYLICLFLAINRLSMYFFLNAIGLSFCASFRDLKLRKELSDEGTGNKKKV
ncbi:MAG: hypothetical protein K6G10_09480 [Butyrivibrio sp.]|nr:hypothetical protein [Butyrivibrio sp.]